MIVSTHSLLSYEYNQILSLESIIKVVSLIVSEVEMMDTSLSGIKYKDFYSLEKKIPYINDIM